MVRKPTRLRFTEDDLVDVHVKKAADRADRAADKAEKAVDKLASRKKSAKLRQETGASGSRKAKLRFGKADNTLEERPSAGKRFAVRASTAAALSKSHQAVTEYEDDNVGIQSAMETARTMETTAYAADHAVYSHKLKACHKADKMVRKLDKATWMHCMRSSKRIILMPVPTRFPVGGRNRQSRKSMLPQKPVKAQQKRQLLKVLKKQSGKLRQ